MPRSYFWIACRGPMGTLFAHPAREDELAEQIVICRMASVVLGVARSHEDAMTLARAVVFAAGLQIATPDALAPAANDGAASRGR